MVFLRWCSTLLLVWTGMAAQSRVLMVQAHPDDETGCAGLLFALSHYIGAHVDICVITNGEAGYRYSTLAEKLYGLKLTVDTIGRLHLPRIRKQEMLQSAQVLGVRNVHFLDERDHGYNQSLHETLAVWDTGYVIQRLKQLLSSNRYEVALVLLPTQTTHGGHKAAAYLLFRAVQDVDPSLLVLGVMDGDSIPQVELEAFVCNRASQSPLLFNRTIRFGYDRRLNLSAPAFWVAAQHLSQGLMPHRSIAKFEYYWVLLPSDSDGFTRAYNWLRHVTESLQASLPNFAPAEP